MHGGGPAGETQYLQMKYSLAGATHDNKAGISHQIRAELRSNEWDLNLQFDICTVPLQAASSVILTRMSTIPAGGNMIEMIANLKSDNEDIPASAAQIRGIEWPTRR